jgi:hypothetical protein
MMEIIAVKGLPKLNVTPLATVMFDSPKIVVELDDCQEQRIRLIFEPYQAARMITADCFDFSEEVELIAQTVMEVKDSPWIEELRGVLEINDSGASFLDKSRHFLLPLQDDFLEIVAWGVKENSAVS